MSWLFVCGAAPDLTTWTCQDVVTAAAMSLNVVGGCDFVVDGGAADPLSSLFWGER
jgi:hypothetical protein